MALKTRNQVAPNRPGLPCSIATVYAKVANDPDELRELNAILYEEDNNQSQVYEYLTRDGGFDVAFQSINKHRSGSSCRCWREEPFKFCRDCKRDLPSCVCDKP